MEIFSKPYRDFAFDLKIWRNSKILYDFEIVLKKF